MMQPNETIQLADLLNGLVELNAVGDNLSPQHFTPPEPEPFELPVTDSILPYLPMPLYLRDKRIGSTTLAAIAQTELAMWHEMVKPSETKPCLTTGTAVHAAIEACISGIPIETYLSGIKVLPNYSRSTLIGVAAEIDYYCDLLLRYNEMPEGMAARKAYADALRSECESKFTIVSEKDAEVIRGIGAEMQRRHAEKPFLDWLQFAKPECTFFWQDFKCRPDLWLMGNEKGLIVSVKTCARIDKAVSAAKYDYGIKEAFYRYIIEQVTGVKQETVFLFFETVAPYQSRLIYVSPETAEYYDQQVEVLIEKATRCLASGKFRGYEANLEHGVEII